MPTCSSSGSDDAGRAGGGGRTGKVGGQVSGGLLFVMSFPMIICEYCLELEYRTPFWSGGRVEKENNRISVPEWHLYPSPVEWVDN